MNSKTLLLFAIGALFALSSCKTSMLALKNETTYVELHKEDIELSARKEANAKQVKVLGIDWSRIMKKESGNYSRDGYVATGSVVSIGAAPSTKVQNYALHTLLLDNPDYDFVMYPRFQSNTVKVLFFFKKTEIKVSARLGKL